MTHPAELPHEEIMRQMAKIATESATEMIARLADEFAEALPATVDGRTALRAFAQAIRSTNAAVFAVSGRTM